MSGPAELWLDPRVIRSINTEPDPEIPLVRYRSDERVAELLGSAAGGDEFFIQLCQTDDDHSGQVLGLTNYGRIYRYSFATKAWSAEPFALPDFGGIPET